MKSKRASGGVGVKLREARTRRNLSLRQIAESTKISVSYLEALERSDISRLPGGLFSRSFVRSYAREVGLDPEKIVDAFLKEFPHELVGVGHPTTTRVEPEDRQAVRGGAASAALWAAVLGVPIVGGLMYFGFAGTGAARSEPAVIAKAAPAVLPSVVIESAVAALPESAAVARGSLLPSQDPAEDPSSDAVLPISVSDEVASPQARALDVPSSRLTVDLRATSRCWVSAVVDGERTIEREFAAGEQQSIVVHTELVLTAGDASALAIAFNGVDARPLGRSGQVVTTSVTPENFQQLLPTQ